MWWAREAGESEEQEKALGPSLGEADRYGNDIITTDCAGCHDTGVYKVLRESETLRRQTQGFLPAGIFSYVIARNLQKYPIASIS